MTTRAALEKSWRSEFEELNKLYSLRKDSKGSYITHSVQMRWLTYRSACERRLNEHSAHADDLIRQLSNAEGAIHTFKLQRAEKLKAGREAFDEIEWYFGLEEGEGNSQDKHHFELLKIIKSALED